MLFIFILYLLFVLIDNFHNSLKITFILNTICQTISFFLFHNNKAGVQNVIMSMTICQPYTLYVNNIKTNEQLIYFPLNNAKIIENFIDFKWTHTQKKIRISRSVITFLLLANSNSIWSNEFIFNIVEMNVYVLCFGIFCCFTYSILASWIASVISGPMWIIRMIHVKLDVVLVPFVLNCMSQCDVYLN